MSNDRKKNVSCYLQIMPQHITVYKNSNQGGDFTLQMPRLNAGEIMAVVVKYVVERNGVERMTFTTKKEADAYDKMLDIAESLELMLEKVEKEAPAKPKKAKSNDNVADIKEKAAS